MTALVKNFLNFLNASIQMLSYVLMKISYVNIWKTKHVMWIRYSLPKVIPWDIESPSY